MIGRLAPAAFGSARPAACAGSVVVQKRSPGLAVAGQACPAGSAERAADWVAELKRLPMRGDVDLRAQSAKFDLVQLLVS